MREPIRDIASLFFRGVARCDGLVRRIFNAAVQHGRGRKAGREAKRNLNLSDLKLTDEMERKMMERLLRDRSIKL